MVYMAPQVARHLVRDGVHFGDFPGIKRLAAGGFRELIQLVSGVGRGLVVLFAQQPHGVDEHFVLPRRPHHVFQAVVFAAGVVFASSEDNSLEHVVRSARQNEVLIYSVGLLSEEDHKAAANAKHQLNELSEATGGEAFYPKEVSEVDPIAHQVARDLRSQYTIEYTPSNPAMDGTFRKIRVAVKAPGSATARTRTGYYATPDQGAAMQPRPAPVSDDNRSNDVLETVAPLPSRRRARNGHRGLRTASSPNRPRATASTVPIFSADTRLVVCHTTVVDKSGQLVTNLKQDAFSVFGERRQAGYPALQTRGYPGLHGADYRQQRQHAGQARPAWKPRPWRW